MKRQTGFTALEIVLLVLFVAAIAFGGFEAYQAHHKPATVTPAPSDTASAQPSASPAPVGVQPCRSANLSLSIGKSDAAAGTTYTALVFTNQSSHACTMNGYPGVSSMSSAGAQIGQPAQRDPAVKPASVTLQPGQAAHATFGHASDTSASNPSCATQSASLKVYPPNQTQALTIAFQGCPVSAIFPVQAGTDPAI